MPLLLVRCPILQVFLTEPGRDERQLALGTGVSPALKDRSGQFAGGLVQSGVTAAPLMIGRRVTIQ